MMSENRKTAFEQLCDDIGGRHSKRLNAILETMDDENFVVTYFKALEYAKPKLQRQEISGKVEIDSITIERVDISSDEIEND